MAALAAANDDWLYMDGVFDLVHAGHFNAMRQASNLSPRLCVGVNDDHDVKLCKGYKPILKSRERAAIISACKWVDRVIDSTPYVTTLNFLRESSGCAYVAHGDDEVATTTGVDCYAEPRAAGLFKLFRRTDGISSTEVTARLRWAAYDLRLLPNEPGCMDMPMPVTTPISSKRLVKFACDNRKVNKPSRCPVDVKEANSSRAEAIAWEQAAPEQSDRRRRVIYTQGAFDVLREGQVDFLESCKADPSDYLVVGILSDAACAALDPSNRHCPILGVNDRMLNILALRVVDEVICNVPWAIDPGLLQAHMVDKVILPVDTPRIAQLTDVQQPSIQAEYRSLGESVNDLRLTLQEFAKAHQDDSSLDQRCQKNGVISRSRAEATTCTEI